MTNLPTVDVATLWNSLEWVRGGLQRTRSVTCPLCVTEAPKAAGLYRVAWILDEGWERLSKVFHARATKRIVDPSVGFAALQPPIVLSIGRTTNIFSRIRQHFGNNRNSNRILSRLRQISPSEWTDEDVRGAAAKSLQVEWAVVPNWVERCLLESYGKAIQSPILDLDAEH